MSTVVSNMHVQSDGLYFGYIHSQEKFCEVYESNSQFNLFITKL